MKKRITPEQFSTVAGKMPACRAAEALGISESAFYYLARQFSTTTSFVSRRWSNDETQKMLALIAAGKTQRNTGLEIGRSEEAVKGKLRKLRGNQCTYASVELIPGCAIDVVKTEAE